MLNARAKGGVSLPRKGNWRDKTRLGEAALSSG